MKKTGSVITAVALFLGIALIAPSAEAGCFAAYAQAVDSCSNLGSGAPEVEEAIALAHEGGVS